MNAQDFITAGQNNIAMLLKGQQAGGALISEANTNYAEALLKVRELQVRQEEARNERELRSEQFKAEQSRLKASHEENMAVQRDSQKISLGNLQVHRYEAQRKAAEDTVTAQMKGAEATTAAARVRLAAATTVFTKTLAPLQEEQAKLQGTLQRAGKMDIPGQPSSLSMLNRLGGQVPPAEVTRAEERLAQLKSQIDSLTESHAKVEAETTKSMSDAIASYGTVVKDSVVPITPMEPLPVLSSSGDDYTTTDVARPPDLPSDEPINNGQEANILPTSGEPTSNILIPFGGPDPVPGAKGVTGPPGPSGQSPVRGKAPRAVWEAMGPVVGVLDENYITELIGLDPMTPEEEAAAQTAARNGSIGVLLPPSLSNARSLVKQVGPVIDTAAPAPAEAPAAPAEAPAAPAEAAAAAEAAAPVEPPKPPSILYPGQYTRFKSHEHALYHKELELYRNRATSAADTSEEGKIARAQALQISSQLEANADKIFIDEQELPIVLQTMAGETGVLSPQNAYRMASRSDNPVIEMGKLQSEAHKAAVQMISKSNLPTMQKNLLQRTYPQAVFDAYERAFTKDGLVAPAEGIKDPITDAMLSTEEVAVRDAFGATAADGKTPWRGYVKPKLGPLPGFEPVATIDIDRVIGIPERSYRNRASELAYERKRMASLIGQSADSSPAPFGPSISQDWWDGNELSDEGEAKYRAALSEHVKDFSVLKIVERVRDLSANLGPKSPAIAIPWESKKGGVEFSGTFGGGYSKVMQGIGAAAVYEQPMSRESLDYLQALTTKATSDTPEAPEAKAVLVDLWTSLASRYAERKLEK